MRLSQCDLPRNVSGSASTMTSYGAVSILRRLRDSLRSVWFSVYASLMLFRHPSHPGMIRPFVGNAVPSATFYDLANMSAKLDTYFWLGFIRSGLPPDKKRHALHGAQRLRKSAAGRHATPLSSSILLTRKSPSSQAVSRQILCLVRLLGFLVWQV